MGFAEIVPNSVCASVGAVLSWSPAYARTGFRFVAADFGSDALGRDAVTCPILLESNETFDDLTTRRYASIASTPDGRPGFRSVREVAVPPSKKKED